MLAPQADIRTLIPPSITSSHMGVIFSSKLLLPFLTNATGMMLSVSQHSITSSWSQRPSGREHQMLVRLPVKLV